jgi:hypothetical protein
MRDQNKYFDSNYRHFRDWKILSCHDLGYQMSIFKTKRYITLKPLISSLLWNWHHENISFRSKVIPISQGLIICIVYYFWINTFWEIAGQWTVQLQNRTFSMSFLKSKSRLFIANIEHYINFDWYKYKLELYNQIKYIKLKKAFEFCFKMV